MQAVSSGTVIADAPDAARYVIDVDGSPVGFLSYRLQPGRISLMHAEVDPAMEGNGLGGQLTAFALDDARARDLAVLPFCPFVKAYIEQHRAEYLELVPPADRARFGL